MKQLPYKLIHEDEELVIINKSAGVLSIPDRYDGSLKNIYQLLKDRFGSIYQAHRLDKFTSGVMMFAKTEAALKDLSLQFENNQVEKIYEAIIEGILPEESGIIEAPIAYNSNKRKMTIQKNGKPSKTYFKAVEKFDGFSHIKLKLETGRTHQIRVHLEYIACPLLVDPVYGLRDGFLLSTIKRKYRGSKNEEERPLLSRTPLHAKSLVFKHPKSKETVNFESEVPKDINACLKQLRKWKPYKDQIHLYD